MLIYKDRETEDEMFTDSYPMKLEDGEVYIITGKRVPKCADDIPDHLIGGNKSAEGVDEDDGPAASSDVEMVINVIDTHRMIEVQFHKKKDFLSQHVKHFVKKVQKYLIEDGKLEDDADAIKNWQTSYTAIIKKHILDKFDDLQFFMGESLEIQATLMAVYYDGETPICMCLKGGLMEEKQ